MFYIWRSLQVFVKEFLSMDTIGTYIPLSFASRTCGVLMYTNCTSNERERWVHIYSIPYAFRGKNPGDDGFLSIAISDRTWHYLDLKIIAKENFLLLYLTNFQHNAFLIRQCNVLEIFRL